MQGGLAVYHFSHSAATLLPVTESLKWCASASDVDLPYVCTCVCVCVYVFVCACVCVCVCWCRYLKEECLELQVWLSGRAGHHRPRPCAEDTLLGCCYIPLSGLSQAEHSEGRVQ